ncbi:hypothetical protein HY310_03735 [Candidatus Microgenomates bacterium]|nr:hypothetical protein [Candidatus Microgenomates bacterium]
MKNLIVGIIFLFLGLSLAVVLRKPETKPNLSGIKPTAFSIENAPINSLRGYVATLSGRVNWLSRVATEPALLNTNILQQGDTLITSDSARLKISFKDTNISLEPKTEVEIIQTLPDQLVFNQKSGEATYSGELSVRSLRLLSKISGTVSIKIKNDLIYLNIVEGKAIAAFNDINFNSKVVEVKKYIIFDNSLRALK